MGYDIERPLGTHETGAVAALPIWLEFMKQAVKDKPVENFKVPDGIVFVKIDAATGEPVGNLRWAKSGKTIFECFLEGTEPTYGLSSEEGTKRIGWEPGSPSSRSQPFDQRHRTLNP